MSYCALESTAPEVGLEGMNPLERCLIQQNQAQRRVSRDIAGHVRCNNADLMQLKNMRQDMEEVVHKQPWSPELKDYDKLLMDDEAWEAYVRRYLFSTPIVKLPPEEEVDIVALIKRIKQKEPTRPAPGRTCVCGFYPIFNRSKLPENYARLRCLQRGARIPNTVLIRILWATRTLVDVEHYRREENRRNLRHMMYEFIEFSDSEDAEVTAAGLEQTTVKRRTKHKTALPEHQHIEDWPVVTEHGIDENDSWDSEDEAIDQERQRDASKRGKLVYEEGYDTQSAESELGDGVRDFTEVDGPEVTSDIGTETGPEGLRSGSSRRSRRSSKHSSKHSARRGSSRRHSAKSGNRRRSSTRKRSVAKAKDEAKIRAESGQLQLADVGEATDSEVVTSLRTMSEFGSAGSSPHPEVSGGVNTDGSISRGIIQQGSSAVIAGSSSPSSAYQTPTHVTTREDRRRSVGGDAHAGKVPSQYSGAGEVPSGSVNFDTQQSVKYESSMSETGRHAGERRKSHRDTLPHKREFGSIQGKHIEIVQGGKHAEKYESYRESVDETDYKRMQEGSSSHTGSIVEVKDMVCDYSKKKRLSVYQRLVQESNIIRRLSMQQERRRSTKAPEIDREMMHVSGRFEARKSSVSGQTADAFHDQIDVGGDVNLDEDSGRREGIADDDPNGHLDPAKSQLYYGIRPSQISSEIAAEKANDTWLSKLVREYLIQLLAQPWIYEVVPEAKEQFLGPWKMADRLVRRFPDQGRELKIIILQEIATIFKKFSHRKSESLLHALITFLHSETDDPEVFDTILITLEAINEQMDVVVANVLSLISIVSDHLQTSICNFLTRLGLVDHLRLVMREALKWGPQRRGRRISPTVQKSLLRDAVNFVTTWRDLFLAHSRMIAEELNKQKRESIVRLNILKILHNYKPECVKETPEGIDVNLRHPSKPEFLEDVDVMEALNYFVEMAADEEFMNPANVASLHEQAPRQADPLEWRKNNGDILVPPCQNRSLQGNMPLLAGIPLPTSLVTHAPDCQGLVPVAWPGITVSITLRVSDKYFRKAPPTTGFT